MNKRDFASGFLAASMGTGGVSLIFQTGYGQTMPPVPFYLTLTPPGQLTTLGNSEKVLVVEKISADQFLVERHQGETLAKDVKRGWIASNAVYVEDINEALVGIQDLSDQFDNLSDVVATKQNILVSGVNIKTIGGQSVLGPGAIAINKSDVGLGNVDNTSDANKPVSTATQTALNGKQASLVSGTNIKTINGNSVLGSGDYIVPKNSITVGTANADYITSTNAQPALNAAVVAANAQGGGVVYVKAGSYSLTSVLNLLDNVSLIADPNTTFTFNSSSYINVINKSNILIQGISFVTQGSMAIQSTGHTNFKIQNCSFTGTVSDAGMIYYNGNAGSTVMDFTTTYITDCKFTNISGCTAVVHLYPRKYMSYDFFSIRNVFTNTSGAAHNIDVYNFAYNTNISNCRFYSLTENAASSSNYGSALAVITRVSTGGTKYVQNLTVENCEYRTTNLVQGTGAKGQGFVFAYNYSGLRVLNNKAFGSWTSTNRVDGPFFAPGRTSEVCEDTIIEGNTIVGFDSPIDHDSSRYMKIINNKVFYCGHGFILGYSVKEYCEIDGNIEYESAYTYGLAYNSYMILGASNKVSCRITNNIIYSTATNISSLIIATGSLFDNTQVSVQYNRFIFPNSTITEIFKKEFTNSVVPLLANFTQNEIIDSTGIKANLSNFYGPVTVPDQAMTSAWDGSSEVPTKNAVYDAFQIIDGGTP